jgi:F0F1-type ATP synthase assembly protein I
MSGTRKNTGKLCYTYDAFVFVVLRALRHMTDVAKIEMGLDDLQSADVNLAVAKEALDQVQKRLADLITTKEAIERKATTLFSSYVTIALALFGVGAALMKDQMLEISPWPFHIAAILFVIGAGLFVRVLHGAVYGYAGSAPDMWLVRGRIDGDEQALARMLAYLVHYHAGRIEDSEASNRRKSMFLHLGMYCGIAGPVVILIGTLVAKYSDVVSAIRL